jgi:hypothetical protein
MREDSATHAPAGQSGGVFTNHPDFSKAEKPLFLPVHKPFVS